MIWRNFYAEENIINNSIHELASIHEREMTTKIDWNERKLKK